MCLVVYLGVERAFDTLPSPEPETFGLEPNVFPVPLALSSKAVVYSVREWGGNEWWCACDLHMNQMHLQEEPPNQTTEAAYAFLRSVIADALSDNAQPVLFSCWDGDQKLRTRVERKIVVSDLRPETCLFDDIDRVGAVGPSPSVYWFGQEQSPDFLK